MKHIVLAMAVTVALLGVLWLMLPGSTAANDKCQETYVVKRGDTLSLIAAKYSTTVDALAKANQIQNGRPFYAGQRLCIPAFPDIPPTPTQPPELYSSLDLVAEYAFDPGAEQADPYALGWTLGRDGRIASKHRYPLLSGDHIRTYTDTPDVLTASIQGSPLLWLSRNTEPEATDYFLVVIGDPKPLLDLQMEMTPTQHITDIIPAEAQCERTVPVHELSVMGAASVTLSMQLMAPDGTFIPVDIAGIAYCANVEDVKSVLLFQQIGFALHKAPGAPEGGYDLLMVLSEDGAGPPGAQWRPRCRSWSGGGRWSRWLRGWFGC